jgi:small subunit ribosomal protein S18
MARSTDRSGGRRGTKEPARRVKKKPCLLCRDKVEWVDYKDVATLRKFMSDRGKIRARRVSGNCTQHQREVAVAIKTARELALLPYTQRTMTERSASRGGRGRGRGAGEDVGRRDQARATAAPVEDGAGAVVDGAADAEVIEVED